MAWCEDKSPKLLHTTNSSLINIWCAYELIISQDFAQHDFFKSQTNLINNKNYS
jgi:hypothetical protein